MQMMKKLFHLHILASALCLAQAHASGAETEGFAEYRFGKIALTAIHTSDFQAKPDVLIGAEAADVKNAEAANAFNISVNAFVVKIGGSTILFDGGVDSKSGGKLLENLAKAKINPADVNYVVLTHSHFDHTGGLVENGKAAFPNATLLMSKKEFDKPADKEAPYLSAYASKLKTFAYGAEILPGVTALDAHGHTRGHTVFMLKDGDAKVLIGADLIHIGMVQFPHPDVALSFDTSLTDAVLSRRRIFDTLAKDGTPVAFAHIKFPGVGKISKKDGGYGFTPLKP